jgi:hypothetical protein
MTTKKDRGFTKPRFTQKEYDAIDCMVEYFTEQTTDGGFKTRNHGHISAVELYAITSKAEWLSYSKGRLAWKQKP